MDRQDLTREQVYEIFDIIGAFDFFVFRKTYDPLYWYKRVVAEHSMKLWACDNELSHDIKTSYGGFYFHHRKRITSKEQLTALFDKLCDIPCSYTIVIPMLECEWHTKTEEICIYINDYDECYEYHTFTNTEPLGILPSSKIAQLFCLCGGFYVDWNNNPYTNTRWSYVGSKEVLQKMIFTYNNDEIVVCRIRTIVLGSLANINPFFLFSAGKKQVEDTKIFDDILKFANDNDWTNEVLEYIESYERDYEQENLYFDDEAEANKPICADEEYKLYEPLFTDEIRQRKSLLKIVDIICGNNTGAYFAIFTNITMEAESHIEIGYPHCAIIKDKESLDKFLDDLKKWQEQNTNKQKLFIHSILVRGEMLSKEQTLSLFSHQKHLRVKFTEEDDDPEWIWYTVYKEKVDGIDVVSLYYEEILHYLDNGNVFGVVCLGLTPSYYMFEIFKYTLPTP